MTRDRIYAAGRYLLMLAMLALLWLASGSGWALGLTVMLLLVPPVSLLGNLYVRRHLRGAVVIPTTAAKGTACAGSLRLENGAWLPAAKLCCRMGLVNDLTGEEETVEFLSGVGPRGSCSRAFSLESGRCGRIYVHVRSVKLMDCFGLFSVDVPMKAAARITVLPELFPCGVILDPVSAVSDESTDARRGDDRAEVFQLREYQNGDDIRQIHWKLSSKLDELILRESSRSVSRSLLVFWDKRYETAPENMDAMAEVTASVCQGLCGSGTAFDLCWTDGEELELHRIRDFDSLLRSIPALVTRAGHADCGEPNVEEYGRVIRITADPPEAVGGDQTVWLVCADAGPDHGGSILFSSQNYSQKLERLEL